MQIRHELRPGDVDEIIRMHGAIYAREHGFDDTFEAYGAGPLAEFALQAGVRDRIWIAENGDRLVGCIAIVESSQSDAQLRWFLIDPAARGRGLGRRLLTEAVEFCKTRGYHQVFLWTVNVLEQAARVYLAAGFARTRQHPRKLWGVDLVEECYEKSL